MILGQDGIPLVFFGEMLMPEAHVTTEVRLKLRRYREIRPTYSIVIRVRLPQGFLSTPVRKNLISLMTVTLLPTGTDAGLATLLLLGHVQVSHNLSASKPMGFETV